MGRHKHLAFGFGIALINKKAPEQGLEFRSGVALYRFYGNREQLYFILLLHRSMHVSDALSLSLVQALYSPHAT